MQAEIVEGLAKEEERLAKAENREDDNFPGRDTIYPRIQPQHITFSISAHPFVSMPVQYMVSKIVCL